MTTNPKTVDERVEKYIERAVRLISKLGYVDPRNDDGAIIEVAKMIQLEELERKSVEEGK